MNTEYESSYDSYSPDNDLDEFREMVAKMDIAFLKFSVYGNAVNGELLLSPRLYKS